jgi:enoyl-CoA hydratase/carnithine racemase
VVATCGALFRGPRSLPVNLGRELLLTGEPVTAQRAYDVGFVNRLCEPGEAVSTALALAERICANSPTSVRATMDAVQSVLGADDARGWDLTRAAQDRVLASDDLREGIQAFLSKRSPRWSGR